jgi:hypothetical protein
MVEHCHGTAESIDGRMLYFELDEWAELGSDESALGGRPVRAMTVREFAVLMLAIVRSN